MNTSTITRLALPAAEHAGLPVGSVDVLPSRAAARWPTRTALVGAGEAVTFAELDRRISRLASGFRDLLGGDHSVVAVSAVPGVQFAIAYYAVARSGNVIAPINPRIGAEVLVRLLVSLGARAAVLSRDTYDRARPALARLDQLEHVLLLDRPTAEPSPLTCAELAGRGDLLVEPRDRDENELGAITLGPDGAGYAKGAERCHHSLKVEAARIGRTHGLSADAVALTAMPSYRQEYLNAAILAGATQVFCASADPAVVAREAERHAASHCYAPGVRAPATVERRAVAS
ncbi:MAG TPA: class I adenylate-forming enzyme family protein [Actinophytocola sp.]|uniref:class I adenylate-forming enzyme family protein n=1 Tax=Actinophytocola sp. TaxID=1872138 RepID=UPI002DDD0148|nr:class I adenylate-forming enzyme family protein [Actinophytocola sp.]HEV2781943.1 class I adenylate-forming enzyme family protein [Actinophytocola sp.]